MGRHRGKKVGRARKGGDGPGPRKSLAELLCMSEDCGSGRQGHQKSFGEQSAAVLALCDGYNWDLEASPMPDTVPFAISQG